MYIHPHPDYNFPKYTNNFLNSKDMPALTEDQLNTLRTNATEQLPAPITKISLHTTNRKIHISSNTTTEQYPDTTHIATSTDTHPQNTDDETPDQIQNHTNSAPALTNALATTDYTPEHNLPPTQDNTTTAPNTQDTTPTQPTTNLNQGQLFTLHLQRKASESNTQLQGGKGKVHQLRPPASINTKTDTPALIRPPQRTTFSHHSSQRTMEQQIQKMQQQSKAPSRHAQTTATHQTPTSTLTAPEISENISAPAPDIPQTQPPRPSNSPSPTEDTNTPSTDMTNNTPNSTKERSGNFHEARRIHEPP
jgi:hypothetical protein